MNIKQINGKYIFSTMGDNNNGQLTVETDITEEQIVGRAVFDIIPYVGWAKLVFYEHSKPVNEKGFCQEY
jgi:hypothetical protein